MESSSLPVRTLGALGICLVGLTGCFGHASPATGGLSGIKQPVLIGPVDRIGMAKPMTVTRVGDYDATSFALFSQHTDRDGYTHTNEISDQSEVFTEAVQTLAGKGTQADIRMTKVKARSYGFWVGVKNKVILEGDVVLVEGAK
jgi:hypothetical protein